MNLCNHPDAVRWNPQNKVVQCHVCGQVWVPLHGTPDVLYRELVLREQARLHDAKPTSPCTGCSGDCLHCSTRQVPAKSAAELMREAGVPNMLEGRTLTLDPCRGCQRGGPACHVCEHGGP
jgi:hypothetical protein